jgi:DsbC/DsbD-like thiol-disulfide interchange protein
MPLSILLKCLRSLLLYRICIEMNYKAIIICIMSAFVSNVANALSHGDLNVVMAGMENHGNRVYVGIEPNPNDCLYGGVYFKDPGELDMALSIAMSAKLGQQKVRIDYIQVDGEGTVCDGFGIYLK